MKQYVIDELRPSDYEILRQYLDARFGPAALGEIYWLPLDTGILSPLQMHHEACQPYYFGLHLAPTHLACELLVRTRSRMSCDCLRYADQTQLNWLIRMLDMTLNELKIMT